MNIHKRGEFYITRNQFEESWASAEGWAAPAHGKQPSGCSVYYGAGVWEQKTSAGGQWLRRRRWRWWARRGMERWGMNTQQTLGLCWLNVDLMLGQHCRLSTSMSPTLGQRLVFAWPVVSTAHLGHEKSLISICSLQGCWFLQLLEITLDRHLYSGCICHFVVDMPF